MYQEVSFKTEQVIYAHTRSDEADMEYKMHCHNSYEIYYMITGNVEYLLEGRSYCPRPGSLLVIAPGCFHGLRVLDGNEYDRIRVHFTEDLLNGKERDGAVLKSSSPLNGIFMQSKSAVLTGRSCRILQFAHGSCRFWRVFLQYTSEVRDAFMEQRDRPRR